MKYKTYKALASEVIKKSDIREKDLMLVSLYTNENSTKDTWVQFNNIIDFENEPYCFNCALSSLGAKYDWQYLHKDITPRLTGVRRLLAAKNAVLISRVFRYLQVLNENHIPFLIIKGGALRLGILSDIPRKICDIDIVVYPKDFDRCKSIAVKLGYEISGGDEAIHSVDYFYNDEHAFDLHPFVYKRSNGLIKNTEDIEDIFNNAYEIRKTGVKILLPNYEDLFLIIAVNIAGNFISGIENQENLFKLLDLYEISKRCDTLSFFEVEKRAKKYHIENHLYLAAGFVNAVMPGSIREFESLDRRPSRKIVRRIRFSIYFSNLVSETNDKTSLFSLFIKRILNTISSWICSYHLDASTFEVIKCLPGELMKVKKRQLTWRFPIDILEETIAWIKRYK